MKNMTAKTVSGSRARAAFTLIELLTVIGIIGLLAALVLTGQAIAKAKMTLSRSQAERDALVTAIERYKKDKGYYPPDNSLNGINQDSVKCTLFYEITGNVVSADGANFTNQVLGTNIATAAITNLFAVNGFLNSGQVPADTRNYYAQIKSEKYLTIDYGGGQSFTVFGTKARGPRMLTPPVNSGFKGDINPVHYVVSNPTNNHSTFDLWFDVLIKGQTNRVSNWSSEPEIVY